MKTWRLARAGYAFFALRIEPKKERKKERKRRQNNRPKSSSVIFLKMLQSMQWSRLPTGLMFACVSQIFTVTVCLQKRPERMWEKSKQIKDNR